MTCLDEDTVLAFVDGRLDAERRAGAARHLADCTACADLVAAVAGGEVDGGVGSRGPRDVLSLASVEPPALARGVRVGRYTILNLVGRGGMGEVYAAYDPQLDRKIALKLLQQTPAGHESPQAGRERLLREAKAIARLSHPNVVVVHDAGAIDDRVFLAMEFVDGQTLAAWLAAAPRSWRAIRDVFVAAGEGLAAAHDAQLVHRDFKPQNVMVAHDGAVRVMDFGLASDAVAATADDAAALRLSAGDAGSPRSMALTTTGRLLGTPLYMAPEQLLARGTDARTDQFSFCVALHEAVYGERPFASDSLPALVQAVTGGKLREPSQKGRAPAFLRRLLLRGLRLNPAERYPSMRALLADLRFDPARRRRLTTFLAAATLLLAIAGLGAQRLATRAQRLCVGPVDKLAEAWEVSAIGARRAAIRRAFLATGVGFAAETWTRVSALLDDYARRWSAGYTHACEATHVRNDQPAAVLAMRITCLEERRDALHALTDVFAHADTIVVVQAVNAAQELPSLAVCDDVAALTGGRPAVSDPAQQARVAELRAALTVVKALTDTGQWPAAGRKVAPLIDATRATGHGALLAEVLEQRAWLEERSGDERAAAATYEEALWQAMAAHRDDVALKCAAQLQALMGYVLNRPDDAARWGRLGETLLRRLGPGHERAASWLMHNRGLARLRQGDHRGALADLRAGLALKQQVLATAHPDIAISWSGIVSALIETGDYTGALDASNRVLNIYRQAYGDDTPLLAHPLGNRGEVLSLLGRHGEAERDLRAAVEGWTVQVAPDHPWVAYVLTALGKCLLADGRPAEAIAPLQRAVDIRGRGEVNRELVAESRFALARARWDAGGNGAEARALAVAARDGYRVLPAHAKHAAEIDAWLASRGTTAGK